jgi:hypothetical protein
MNATLAILTLLIAPYMLSRFPARAWADDSLAPSTQKLWFDPDESAGKKATLFAPRLLGRPVFELFKGKTVHRVLNTGMGVEYVAKALDGDQEDGLTCAGYRSADGLLNPGGTLNDLIADTAFLAKSPTYSTSGLSNRIQVCTENLSTAASSTLTKGHPLDPMMHVGVMIDHGVYGTADPAGSSGMLADALSKGGIRCYPAPNLSNETQSVAIERLECANSNYSFDYRFMTNNCGSYTADILKIAGLGFPDLPNAGVGLLNRTQKRKRDAEMKKTKDFCDMHMQNFKDAIGALEEGKPLSSDNQSVIKSAYSDDAKIQLAISASRSNNSTARQFVQSVLKDESGTPNSYFVHDSKDPDFMQVRRPMRKHLQEMFSGLTPNQRQWLSESFPWMAGLLATH